MRVDAIMQEHVSVVDRARDVLRAVFMDPTEYRSLVQEIAKAISDAEMRGIKNCQTLIRETLGGESAV